LVSFDSTATTAKSVVDTGNLQVTHEYKPAEETPYLYRMTVSITNNGDDINELLYRRVMDWDIEPNYFNEYVTIQGTAAATNVLSATNQGFRDTSPFDSSQAVFPHLEGDFVDGGPNDHGAQFDFGFGALLNGETRTFEIFYGAAPTESGAIGALVAVGAEVYSLAQPDSDILGTGFDGEFETATFIFAFAGVGGDPIVPEPSTCTLFGIGLAMLTVAARRGMKRGA
jgi:type IV pilus assembly protein PilY1